MSRAIITIALHYVYFSIMASGFALAAAADSEMPRAFLDGLNQYRAGDYDEAISSFTRIAESGVRNSKLFYNLGNACLKSGDLGRAVWWYERALKLAPNDPDLKFNHNYALSLIKDAPEENVSVYKILFFWRRLLSQREVQWVAIFLNLLLWQFFILQTLLKKSISRTAGYLLVAITAVFVLTAAYNHYQEVYAKHAVILPAEVSVRSGFADDSTELFVLHAGTKVKLERENRGFLRIYFSEGKIGWIRKSDAGVI
jgi:tetratricopeptide (TPR) repeat protein